MKNIVILFGGKSLEHEVSIYSALSLYENFPRHKYNPLLVGVDKQGNWKCDDNLIIKQENWKI